jgi:hypothetical protein
MRSSHFEIASDKRISRHLFQLGPTYGLKFEQLLRFAYSALEFLFFPAVPGNISIGIPPPVGLHLSRALVGSIYLVCPPEHQIGTGNESAQGCVRSEDGSSVQKASWTSDPDARDARP